MNAQAKFTTHLGWCLAAAGGIAFIVSCYLRGGPGSISEFVFLVSMIVGVFLFVPGVLLFLLGHFLGQIDERLRSLEEELESGRRQGTSSEKLP